MLRRETDVCNVLGGDRRQVDPHAGKIDVLARSQDPAVQHPAAEIALEYFQYLQVDQSVVDRDPITHLKLLHHVLVVDVDGFLLRIRGGADGDVELLTDLEGQVRKAVAGADGRSLQVEQQGDRVVEALVELLDGLEHLQMARVVAMRHVEPRDVHAGGGKLFDLFRL